MKKVVNRIYEGFDSSIRAKTFSMSILLTLVIIQNAQLLLLSIPSNRIDSKTFLKWPTYNSLLSLNTSNPEDLKALLPVLILGLIAGLYFIMVVLFIIGACKQTLAYLTKAICQFYVRVLFLPISSLLFDLLCTELRSPSFLLIGIVLLILVGDIVYLINDLFIFSCTYREVGHLRRNPIQFVQLRLFCLNLVGFLFALDSVLGLAFAEYGRILCIAVAQITVIYEILGRLNYFSVEFAKLKLSVTIVSASFSSMMLLSKVTGQDSLLSKNFLVTCSVVYVSILLLSLNYRNYTVKNLAICSSEDINNANLFQSKMRIFEKMLVSVKSKKAELLRSAVLRSHMKECTSVDCVCKRRDQLWDPARKQKGNSKLQPQRDTPFSKAFIKMNFEEGIAKFSDSVTLLGSYAYFIEDVLGLYMKVCIILRKMELNFSNTLTKTWQFLIFSLRKSVKLQLSSNYRASYAESCADISKLDTIKENLYRAINQVVQLLVCFWKSIAEPIVEQNILHQTCQTIQDKKKAVFQLFRDYLSIDRNSKEITSLLSIYANRVIFNNKFEQEIQKTFKARFDDDRNNFSITNEEMTCVVKATLGSDGHLPVLWVSNNFIKLFGYSKQEVIGASVSHLMPPSFVNAHDAAVMAWRESGRQTIMNTSRVLWAVDKNKVCFSCTISLRPLIQDNDMNLLSMVVKEDSQDFVLLNSKRWTIESAGTRLFSEIFKVRSQIVFDRDVELHAFSPELFTLYHKNSQQTTEQAHTVNFLIPKNIEGYLETYHELKQKSLQTNQLGLALNKEDPQYAEVLDEYVSKTLQNLIVLASQLDVIIQAKITMRKMNILTSGNDFSVRVLKIQELKPLRDIPPFIISLRNNAKTQIHLQIAHLKTLRTNRRNSMMDKLVKCFNTKKTKPRWTLDHLRLNIARRIRSGIVGRQQHHQQELKKESIRQTVEKIRRVLRKHGILGRSIFSLFYDKNQKETIDNEVQLCGQIVVLAMEKQRPELEDNEVMPLLRDEDLTTDRKVKTASTLDNNEQLQCLIEEMSFINRRYKETKPENKITAITLLVLLIFSFYLGCKGATILINRKIVGDVKALFSAQLSSAQVFRNIQAISLFGITNMLATFRMQYVVPQQIAYNAASVNNKISKLLSEHLAKKQFRTFQGVQYYEYINQKIPIETDKQQMILPFLSAARYYQNAALQLFQGNILSQQFALHLLLYNGHTINEFSRNVSINYREHIKEEISLFNVLVIVLALIRILLTFVLLLIFYKIYEAKDKWTLLCSEALCSVNGDISSKYVKYYKGLTFDQSKGFTNTNKIQDGIELLKLNSGESRRPQVKGKISKVKFYGFILTLFIYTTNELLVITHLTLSQNWKKVADVNVQALKSQGELTQALIKTKNDFLRYQANLTQYMQLFGNNGQNFVDAIRDLFLYVPNQQAYLSRVLPILKSDLCNGYPTPVLDLQNSQCSSRDSNQYGLMMNAQLMAQQTKKAYEIHYNQGFFAFLGLLYTQNWAQLQNTALYLLNGCHIIGQAILQSIEIDVNIALNIGDIITYTYLALVAPAIFLFYRTLRQILVKISKTKEHIFLLPPTIFVNNLYIKRFLSEFIKEFS